MSIRPEYRPTPHPMSDDDRSFIAQALRLAGERYAAHAAEMRKAAELEPAKAAGFKRLAEQFERQVATVGRLADVFDEADAITVTA